MIGAAVYIAAKSNNFDSIVSCRILTIYLFSFYFLHLLFALPDVEHVHLSFMLLVSACTQCLGGYSDLGSSGL